jgi:hypothetical protein
MNDTVITWLTESSNSAVKYRTHTELLGLPKNNEEVFCVTSWNAICLTSSLSLSYFWYITGFWASRFSRSFFHALLLERVNITVLIAIVVEIDRLLVVKWLGIDLLHTDRIVNVDKKVLPPVTAIIMPGKNQDDTINSLSGCNGSLAEIIFCTDLVGAKISSYTDHVDAQLTCYADGVDAQMTCYADGVGAQMFAFADHVGAALADASGDYICILPAGTLLQDDYLTYPIEYLERHTEFDYSVCDPTYIEGHGNKGGVHNPTFNSLQITDYFFGHSNVEIAAFIVRKAFLAETGILSVTANCTFPELLILPILAFGYGVHIAKSLYSAEKTFILSQELSSYVSEAHDMIKRFPISATDIRELLFGFDFMTARKLLNVYDCDTAGTFSDYICPAINNAFNPCPRIPLTALTDSVKSNKTILLTALNHAYAGKKVKSMKPAGRVIAFAPLSHSAIKIKELLRLTAYEPDIVWAMNGDANCAAIPDLPSLTGNDIVVVPRRSDSLEREFSPASVVSAWEALSRCAALAFPTLCDGNTTIRFSSGYFYDY